MATTNINIRTDGELKSRAQEILNDLGLDLSTAINIFLRQLVQKEGIPFEISRVAENDKHPVPGGWEGKIHMSKDFNESMEEFKEYTE